jgi:hypothetical protein
MLGVHDGMFRGRDFERQTIIDNVQLLDEDRATVSKFSHKKFSESS